MLNSGHVEKIVLQVVDKKSFHLRGSHAAVRLSDVKDRHAEVRKNIARHPLDGEHTQKDGRQDGNQNRRRPAQSERYEVHLLWWLARYISAPVADLQKSARTLTLGNFEFQVDDIFCRRHDELGILARDFNRMAARLHSQIASKETLLRDISHELRSPLTRLRVALSLAQMGDQIEVQHKSIEREVERLDALIGETLQLSRLSGAVPTFVRDNVDLGVLLNEVTGC
jgi:signal transduction histidine kinase